MFVQDVIDARLRLRLSACARARARVPTSRPPRAPARVTRPRSSPALLCRPLLCLSRVGKGAEGAGVGWLRAVIEPWS